MALAGVLLIGAVVSSYLNRMRFLPAPTRAQTVRTETVQRGTIQRTVRLTGVTQARNFFTLLAPELRGSRTGKNRTSTATASSGSPGTGGSGTSATGTAVGGSGQSTGSSASSSTAAASTGGSSSAPGATSAFRAATSRFGATLRGSAPTASSTNKSATATTPASASLGGSGLGSTGDSLPGGTQGPPAVGSSSAGGDNEWQIVLEDVVPAGSKVQKDQVVATFDRQYMLLRLDDYRASVTQSDAALQTQKADLATTRKAHAQLIESAKGALEKARLDMRTIPVLSAIDAERTRLAFDEAQARYQQLLEETKHLTASQDSEIRNSELDLEEAKLELKRAESNANTMVVRAPAHGLVVMETMWRGGDFAKIQKGDQVWAGEPFMKVVDTTSMMVSAMVNQVDVEMLRLGAKASVHFDAYPVEAYPELNLDAYVETIGAMTAEAGSRQDFVRMVPVRFRIEGKNGALDPRVIPDLTVSVDVNVAPPLQAAAVAPLGAVFHGADGQAFVYLKQGEQWVRRKVETGSRNNTLVAITHGLSERDIVALDPQPQASDG